MGKEIRKEVIDYVTPDVDGMVIEKRARNLHSHIPGMLMFEDEINKFKQEVLLPSYNPDVKKTPSAKAVMPKRKREDSELGDAILGDVKTVVKKQKSRLVGFFVFPQLSLFCEFFFSWHLFTF
jgi:hypothetical protein